MKQSIVNKEAIITVARALEEIHDRVVYVGGAVIGLYTDDPAAEDLRPTKDVDIVLQIMTEGELESLRRELTSKGFKQTAEDDVVCRFRYENILIDVMSTHAVGWAPANPWFAPGFRAAERAAIGDIQINILSLPYFLATKFSAYHLRGGGDPRTSHDMEDIVYILDNRTDLVQHCEHSPADVKDFLKQEFAHLISDDIFREAVLAHLEHGNQKERFAIIIEKVKQIIGVV